MAWKGFEPTNFTEIHAALSANSLVGSAIATIPMLTGNEDYINWSDQVITVFKYCGIEKILTGEWTKPSALKLWGQAALASGDSGRNARDWNALDTWISLHLNLSGPIRSQVRHLTTSHDKWTKLKELFSPTSESSITSHLLSIVNIHFDESTEFEEFVASKREHNRLLGELGGTSLPDSYVAILIRSGLPERLKQIVADITDDTVTTDQLIDIIHSRN